MRWPIGLSITVSPCTVYLHIHVYWIYIWGQQSGFLLNSHVIKCERIFKPFIVLILVFRQQPKWANGSVMWHYTLLQLEYAIVCLAILYMLKVLLWRGGDWAVLHFNHQWSPKLQRLETKITNSRIQVINFFVCVSYHFLSIFFFPGHKNNKRWIYIYLDTQLSTVFASLHSWY